MKLRLTAPAARDLRSIVDYIAADSPSAARRVFRAIMASARRLTRYPHSGRPGRLPDTRELPVTDLPYLLVYEVEREAVNILAVFHGARDLVRELEARHEGAKRGG